MHKRPVTQVTGRLLWKDHLTSKILIVAKSIDLRSYEWRYALSPLRRVSPAWLTLITCENYIEKTDVYTHRRMVRAVLVSVEKEK